MFGKFLAQVGKQIPQTDNTKFEKSTPLSHRRLPVSSSYYARQQNKPTERNKPAKKTASLSIIRGRTSRFLRGKLGATFYNNNTTGEVNNKKTNCRRRRRCRLTRRKAPVTVAGGGAAAAAELGRRGG